MGAVIPLPVYSNLQNVSATDLMKELHNCIEWLFPTSYFNEEKVSAFFLNHSSGKGTLILGSALAYTPLRNSCDPLREVSPTIFDWVPRGCTRELFDAITNYGRRIPESPEMVAIEVDVMEGPILYGVHPHQALARLIRGEVFQVRIGTLSLRMIHDSWVPPAGNPTWQGIAFERSDRLVRTWVHEANPNALQGARDDAQRHIDEVLVDQQRKVDQKNRHVAAGRYHGQLETRTEKELEEINRVLAERQNHLAYLNAQTVNSMAHSTLQCNIVVEVDQPAKLKLLERSICQSIATVIDQALERVSWIALGISVVAIDSLIRQKLNTLIEKVEVLIPYSQSTLTDWKDFKDEVLVDKQVELRQTYQDLCQQRFGHPEPTDSERPQMDQIWKKTLSERFKWVTARLRMADEQLKMVEHYTFTQTDISIFESHRTRMVDVLKKADALSYGLGLELSEKYGERNLVRNAARTGVSVLLVKRVTETGHIIFGVTRPSTNPADRPDPSARKNEAHVPIKTVQMPHFGQQG